MGGLLYTADDGGLLHFVLITLIIGGILAWQAGRAIAGTWRPFAIVPVYMLLLSAGIRFLHYQAGTCSKYRWPDCDPNHHIYQ